MYVIWNYGKVSAPLTLDGITLYATYDDAFHALVNNTGHIGNTLGPDSFIIESTETVIRGKTVGERLRDYYIGA